MPQDGQRIEDVSMISQAAPVSVALHGNEDEQKLAEMVLNVLLARGMFMSANAPIRIPVSSLTKFFEDHGESDVSSRVEAAIAANPEVFATEDLAGEMFVLTTRVGRVPAITPPPMQHT